MLTRRRWIVLNREEAGNLLIWNRVHCHEEEEGDANDNKLAGHNRTRYANFKPHN